MITRRVTLDRLPRAFEMLHAPLALKQQRSHSQLTMLLDLSSSVSACFDFSAEAPPIEPIGLFR